MAIKILAVKSLATERHPVGLNEKIEQSVEDFSNSPEGGEVERIDIRPEFNSGDSFFGRALVTVYFKPSGRKGRKEEKNESN